MQFGPASFDTLPRVKMSSFTKVFLLIFAMSISDLLISSEARIQSTRGSVYHKVYWSKKDAVLLKAEANNLKTCSLLCVQHNKPGASECSGFYFDSSSSKCTLFQGIIRGVDWVDIADPSTDLVYRKAIQCPVPLGYKLVSVGSCQFCLGAFWLTPLNNSQARDECNKHGGNLVDMDDDRKYEALTYLWGNVADSFYPYCWIGGSDEAVEGKFVFGVSGKPMASQIRWQHKQPDDGNHAPEDCVIFDINQNQVNDIPCYEKRVYTCEIRL